MLLLMPWPSLSAGHRGVPRLPKRLVMNEVMLGPTWNRAYVAAIRNLSNL